MKNLFIRGAIRIGKSTHLRNMVNSTNLNIIGFSGQRIIDSKSIVKGYQAFLVKKQKMPGVDVLYTPELEDIFIFESKRDCDILKRIIKDINESIQEESFDLIVLDETGGFELKFSEIFLLLCSILKKEIPCIGIIKEYNDNFNYKDEYTEFESLIKSNGKILDVDKNNLELIDKEIGILFWSNNITYNKPVV